MHRSLGNWRRQTFISLRIFIILHNDPQDWLTPQNGGGWGLSRKGGINCTLLQAVPLCAVCIPVHSSPLRTSHFSLSSVNKQFYCCLGKMQTKLSTLPWGELQLTYGLSVPWCTISFVFVFSSTLQVPEGKKHISAAASLSCGI